MSESLWQRLRRARVVQVLLVYLGASWVVLQIAELLAGGLSLPEWLIPVTIVLLLVGLVVIVSTAWVQSLPSTTAGERAGELPTDWQLAPGEAVTSVLSGRLPHLTWARAIVGGVVVLALLFGGAGLYVGVRGGPVAFGPSEVTASEAAEGIAVIPFDVRGGPELDIWREGMMDLLSNNLDGVGGFRTIDARTVMARWLEQVGEGMPADLTTALRAANATGARYALEGSVVGLGSEVRLAANVYDLDTATEVAQASVQGATADVLRLVDELAVAVMRDLLREVGRSGAGDLNAETLTTTSLPALRAFLEGESRYRRGRFAEAVQAYERAVAEDTAFAIALIRLSEAYGWLESQNSENMVKWGERAAAHVDRLSPRYQFIMHGWTALNRGTADGVEALEEAVRKYPDDPEAWFLLAETYIHVGGATYGTFEETRQAVEQAVALDPNFAPYRAHQAHLAVLAEDRAAAEEARDTYYRLTGERSGLEEVELGIPLILGDSAEVEAALAAAADAPERSLDLYGGTFARRHDRAWVDERMDALLGDAGGVDRTQFQAYYAVNQGEIVRGARVAAGISPASRGVFWGHANELWDVPPPTEDDPGGSVDTRTCDAPAPNTVCYLFVGMAAARWERWEDHARAVAHFRALADSLQTDEPERAEIITAYGDVLEGAGLWRRGDIAAGRTHLERHRHRGGFTGERARLELGWLESADGRPAMALPHFRTALEGWSRTVALYGMARMHDQLGEHDQARRYYEHLATMTRNGDPLPRIQEVRAVLAHEGR